MSLRCLGCVYVMARSGGGCSFSSSLGIVPLWCCSSYPLFSFPVLTHSHKPEPPRLPRILACWAPCQQAPTFLRKELGSGWRAAGIGLPSGGLFPDRKAGLGLLGRDQSLELPLREQVPPTSCSIQPCSHRSTGWAGQAEGSSREATLADRSRSQARGHRKSWGGKGSPAGGTLPADWGCVCEMTGSHSVLCPPRPLVHPALADVVITTTGWLLASGSLPQPRQKEPCKKEDAGPLGSLGNRRIPPLLVIPCWAY